MGNLSRIQGHWIETLYYFWSLGRFAMYSRNGSIDTIVMNSWLIILAFAISNIAWSHLHLILPLLLCLFNWMIRTSTCDCSFGLLCYFLCKRCLDRSIFSSFATTWKYHFPGKLSRHVGLLFIYDAFFCVHLVKIFAYIIMATKNAYTFFFISAYHIKVPVRCYRWPHSISLFR